MKVHIGCGKRNFGNDWLHVDGGKYDHIDHDDVTLSTWRNECADLIYSSHLLSYFDREEVKELLKQWYRVLKPEGILRVAVPNFEAMAWLYSVGGYSLRAFLGPLYGKMQMGDKTIYHKTAYDLDSLSVVLSEAGFKQIGIYDWRQTEHARFDDCSQAYLPHMDKEKGLLISLNVECRKWI